MSKRILSDDERFRILQTNGRRDDFLHRPNYVYKPEIYDFDSYTFEDLIDNFTPEEDLPIILRCDKRDLDIWCKAIYNMPFHETFLFLSKKADFYCRKAFTQLSKSGNNSAIKLVGEHFMKLNQDNNKKSSIIPILTVMPSDNSSNELCIGVNVGYDEEDEEND